MAAYKQVNIKEQPRSGKNPVIANEPQVTDIVSWRLTSASTDKKYWPVFGKDADNVFETTILPFLIDIERYKWSLLLTEKQKKCHEIEVSKLNRKAQKRLDDLCIETEKVLVLHLQGQHCLYGFLIHGIFHILWYDIDHGDNEECVCRSFKKGDKKKHQR